MQLIDLKVREEIPELLNSMGLTGLGAEIGVQRGEFSHQLLSKWWGKKLYMIDIWRQIDSYKDIANVDHNGQLQFFAETFMRTYEYGDRPVIIRESSEEAAKFFADESLDFVFIDADHSYEGCMKDMKIWYPKVKKGGLFCGHDYCYSPAKDHPDANGHTELGVKPAVDEFFLALGQTPHITTEGWLTNAAKTPIGSWYFIK